MSVGRVGTRFVDIGANLIDQMYQGVYHGSTKHEPDLLNVLTRAWDNGLEKIFITGTSLSESKIAIKLSQLDDRLYATVGCHPTQCNEIAQADNPENYFSELVSLCQDNKEKVVAVGELGLDYDRLHFCKKETQLMYFEEQLKQFSEIRLPLFLHSRNAADDFLNILKRCREDWSSGVVHSFTGALQEAKDALDLGLYIGINGCSLKTEENLQVLKELPEDRILLETDSPWCEVRPTHAGAKYLKTKFPSCKKEKWEAGKMVKGRNEPAAIRQVLEIVAGVKEMDVHQLAETIYENHNKLFFQRR